VAGFISVKEMSKALSTIGGIQATDKEVDQVIAEATHNNDRKISYEIFKRVMIGK
jgi:Ca2+-binding EF-hand superfamily protein